MENWYTLHTKPNAEYRVNSVLQQRGIQIYLPEIKVHKANKRSGSKPFFPCYLFASFDFELIELSSVQWTPGLRRVVTFDDQPVPVPNHVIDLIRYKLGEIELSGGQPLHSFKQGDTVYISDGPFQGMLAIFDGPTTPSERVRVLLDILGHINRVYVDVADLKKTEPEVEVPPTKRVRRTRGRGRRI